MADKKISALTASTTPLAGTEVLPIVQGGSTVKVSIANVTAGRAVNALSLATTSGAKNTSSGSDIASPSDGVYFTDGANKNVIVQLGASGQLSTFVYEAGGAGWRRVAALLTNGNNVVDVGNIVIGTAGKGIDFSANANAPGMTSELLTWYETGTWTPVLGRSSGGTATATYAVQQGKYTRVGNMVTVSAFLDVSAVTSQGTGDNYVGGLPFSPADNGLGAGVVSRNSAFTTVAATSCFTWSSGVVYFREPTNGIAGIDANWRAGYLTFTATYFV